MMSKLQFYQARSLNKKWHELSKEHDRQGPRGGWWTSSPSPARWGWIGVLRFKFVAHCRIGGFGQSRSFTSTRANTLNIAKVICKCLDYFSIHAQQTEIPEPRQGIGKSRNSFQVRQQLENGNQSLDNQQNRNQYRLKMKRHAKMLTSI
jgi:hypothetical protein